MKLLLVGCGKMGAALLRRAAAAGVLASATVVEPAGQGAALADIPMPVAWHSAPNELAANYAPDLIVLAVKPQSMAEVLPHYARFAGRAVFLSIAAGLTLGRLQAILTVPAALVRSMPNLPASIGAGATALVANALVTSSQRSLADQFVSAVGTVVWLEDESLMDAVTALSGSGPAYVFALCEAMAQAGESLGLPADMAVALARQTVIGSGALLATTTDSAEDLRRAVTSPKGTTEAALKQLQDSGALAELVKKAMTAARDRARELAQ